MEWISVEDRLPNKEDVVIICVGGIVSVGDFLGMHLGEQVWDYVDGEAAYGVTHWMPLPSAPVGSSHGG